MEKKCCICKNILEADTAAILTISGYAVPRYICSECEQDFDTVTSGTEPADIYAAMERLGNKVFMSGTDDETVIAEVKQIMDSAKERADKISEGNYDFTVDENDDEDTQENAESFEEETEQEREQARIEAERAKKFDKITNAVCLSIIVIAVGFFTYWILKRFL